MSSPVRTDAHQHLCVHVAQPRRALTKWVGPETDQQDAQETSISKILVVAAEKVWCYLDATVMVEDARGQGTDAMDVLQPRLRNTCHVRA